MTTYSAVPGLPFMSGRTLAVKFFRSRKALLSTPNCFAISRASSAPSRRET